MADQQAPQKTADGMLKSIGRGGFVLALFALIGAGLLALINLMTDERRLENQHALVIAAINAVVDIHRYNNNPLEDRIEVVDTRLDRSEAVTIYRARNDGRNVAAIIEPVAPDGYSGNIRLLVGINSNGKISGVRVVAHKETPGLGDGIDIRRSNWIQQFDGQSLSATNRSNWAVQKDGGIYDSMTGATITSRAVVEAVERTLSYFDEYRELIFSKPAISNNELPESDLD